MKNKIFWFTLIAGLLLRLAFVFWHPYPDTNDARQYDVIATNIVNGHGISQEMNPPYVPEIDRVPFYPIFMAFFYLIFGHHLVIIRIVQAVLSIATAFFVYFIAKKIIRDGKPDYLPSSSLALALLCPFLILFVSILFAETLDAFLITLSLLFFIYGIHEGKKYLFSLSGLIMGLSLMTRPEICVFPVLLSAVFFFTNLKDIKKAIKYIGIFLLPFFIIWGVWIARNYLAFSRFVPITTQDGALLLIGTYPPNRYEKDFPQEVKEEYIKFRFIPEKERIGVVLGMRRRAIQRISDQPLLYAVYCLQRIPILWINSYAHYIGIDATFSELFKSLAADVREHKGALKNVRTILIKLFLYLINVFYLITGFLGILLLISRWPRIYPLYLAIFYFTLIHLPLGDASPRYMIKILPIFLIFSAAGMLFIYNQAIMILPHSNRTS